MKPKPEDKKNEQKQEFSNTTAMIARQLGVSETLARGLTAQVTMNEVQPQDLRASQANSELGSGLAKEGAFEALAHSMDPGSIAISMFVGAETAVAETNAEDAEKTEAIKPAEPKADGYKPPSPFDLTPTRLIRR